MQIDTLPLTQIVVQNRLRSKLNEAAVEALMESIQEIGLKELPCVRWIGGDDEHAALVVGWHRLEAMRRLGNDWISCRIFEGDETEARLWEIAENLHRADLTELEKHEQWNEWRELTVKQGKTPSGQVAHSGGSPDKGHSATAEKFGLSRRAVARAQAIAENIVPEAKETAIEAGLDDNQSALLTLTKIPPEEQVAKVQEMVDEKEANKAAKALERQAKKAARLVAGDARGTARAPRRSNGTTSRKAEKPTVEKRIQSIRKYLVDLVGEEEVRIFGEMLIGICDPLARVLMQ